MMFAARLLGGAAELAGNVKHVGDERAPAHLVVADLGILAVLRAEHAQALAISVGDRIEEVTEHVVAFNAGLKP